MRNTFVLLVERLLNNYTVGAIMRSDDFHMVWIRPW